MQYRERPILSQEDEWNDLTTAQKWNEYRYVLGLMRKFRGVSGSPSIKGKIDRVGKQQRNTGAQWAALGNTVAAAFVQFPWTAFLWVPLFGAQAMSTMNAEGWVDMVADLIQGAIATWVTFMWAHHKKRQYRSD